MLDRFKPKKSLRAYMKQYGEEHQHPGTKATHMVGIPMILASFPVGVVSPPIGGALFVGGWALQFIGHGVFEKSKPSFVNDPYYLGVGAVWVTVEYMQLLGLPIPEALQPEPEVEAVHVTNGIAASA
jgi:uncharacterized membrane protein YGL010W